MWDVYKTSLLYLAFKAKKLIFILVFIIDQNNVSNILKYNHVVHKKGYDSSYLPSNYRNFYWSSNLSTSAIDQWQFLRSWNTISAILVVFLDIKKKKIFLKKLMKNKLTLIHSRMLSLSGLDPSELRGWPDHKKGRWSGFLAEPTFCLYGKRFAKF